MLIENAESVLKTAEKQKQQEKIMFYMANLQMYRNKLKDANKQDQAKSQEFGK